MKTRHSGLFHRSLYVGIIRSVFKVSFHEVGLFSQVYFSSPTGRSLFTNIGFVLQWQSVCTLKFSFMISFMQVSVGLFSRSLFTNEVFCHHDHLLPHSTQNSASAFPSLRQRVFSRRQVSFHKNRPLATMMISFHKDRSLFTTTISFHTALRILRLHFPVCVNESSHAGGSFSTKVGVVSQWQSPFTQYSELFPAGFSLCQRVFSRRQVFFHKNSFCVTMTISFHTVHSTQNCFRRVSVCVNESSRAGRSFSTETISFHTALRIPRLRFHKNRPLATMMISFHKDRSLFTTTISFHTALRIPRLHFPVCVNESSHAGRSFYTMIGFLSQKQSPCAQYRVAKTHRMHSVAGHFPQKSH